MFTLGLDLQWATIHELQRRMEHGSITSTDLTEEYLSRIDAANPLLHAVLCTAPHALRQASASDDRRRAHRILSPLDGIPVLLKDNIDTADLPTTAGSRAMLGTPAADAALVRRLRTAGAVVLGKTNLSEWANFRSTSAISGWSGVGGQTRNPHSAERSPGGSSSGSATAIAAALAQVAIGTETNGSIVSPAALTGVVGLRPTLGWVSRSGVVPISLDQDVPGPIARNAADAALTLSVLAGPDLADPVTLHGPLLDLPDPESSRPLAGARVGLRRVPAYGAGVGDVVDCAAATLRAAGAEVVSVRPSPDERIQELMRAALVVEFRRDLTRYLRARPGAPNGIAEIVAFNQQDAVETSCFVGQDLLEGALSAPDAHDPEHHRVRTELTVLARRSLGVVFDGHQLDMIVTPSNQPAWRISDASEPAVDTVRTASAVAGHPEITVPAGAVDGLPVGLSFLGRRWEDARVLAIASAFERVASARISPAGHRPSSR